jgi:hypothetical protein
VKCNGRGTKCCASLKSKRTSSVRNADILTGNLPGMTKSQCWRFYRFYSNEYPVRYRRLPLQFTWSLSSGMLHSVGWFCTDVSGLRIGLMSKKKLLLGHLDPWRRDRYVVPKRRCETNLRCVTSQKTTQFKYRVVCKWSQFVTSQKRFVSHRRFHCTAFCILSHIRQQACDTVS